MTTHEARIELMPLKRQFGLSRADVEDYARAIVGHTSNITPEALGEAVTRCLVLAKRPGIHEVMGLALARRSAHVAVPTLTARGVREGDPVADHECHRCGGEVEYRAPFLYCRPCKATQQVGRGMDGHRRYALTVGEAVDLEAPRPLAEDAAA